MSAPPGNGKNRSNFEQLAYQRNFTKFTVAVFRKLILSEYPVRTRTTEYRELKASKRYKADASNKQTAREMFRTFFLPNNSIKEIVTYAEKGGRTLTSHPEVWLYSDWPRTSVLNDSSNAMNMSNSVPLWPPSRCQRVYSESSKTRQMADH
ncbi:hypothetical protein Peur_043185 [Populus x canadensis]